jgi:hypothetical protein
MIRILFFLLITSSVFAQQKVTLNGQIQVENDEIAFITIVNRSLKKGTISNIDGTFKIEASINDILDISSLQYQGQEITVTARMLEEQSISIFLEPKTTLLPEISISNIELSGNLDKDAATVEEINPLEYSNSNRKLTPSERRFYTATTRGEDAVGMDYLRFDIPLAAVFNAVSGKTKKLKTQIKKEKALAQVVELENKFAPHFFTEGLEIPLEKVEDFLFYAQVKNNAIYNYQKINSLELINLLIEQAESYKIYTE